MKLRKEGKRRSEIITATERLASGGIRSQGPDISLQRSRKVKAFSHRHFNLVLASRRKSRKHVARHLLPIDDEPLHTFGDLTGIGNSNLVNSAAVFAIDLEAVSFLWDTRIDCETIITGPDAENIL